MEAISYTAQWTAAARALESDRPSPLFNDPYARELAGHVGFELLHRYDGAGVLPFLAIRTRYVDEATLRAVNGDRVRQVVVVAAGMDARAFRLPWPTGVVVYELDRPALLEAKARLLSRAAPADCERRVVAVDLGGAWADPLLRAGFEPSRPTVWVVEGLLFFLPEDAVQRLLTTLRALSAPGGTLVGDMTSRASLSNPLAQRFLRALAADGTPWQFGTDDPEGFLRGCGWRITDLKQPGEEGAAFGRWPHPVAPRGIPGVPRSFLLTAAPAEDAASRAEARRPTPMAESTP